MITGEDLTAAYLSGLHEGRKREQDRILRIVQSKCKPFGVNGACVWAAVKTAVNQVVTNPALKTESGK